MCVSDDDDAAACKAPISAVSDEAACRLSLNVAWGVFGTDTQQPGVKKKTQQKNKIRQSAATGGHVVLQKTVAGQSEVILLHSIV